MPSRCGELTFEVPADAAASSVCRALRDEPGLRFEQLIDLSGVDYLDYGRVEWKTEIGDQQRLQPRSAAGLACGTPRVSGTRVPDRRFAVVYHLLSVTHNRRLRLRVLVRGRRAADARLGRGVWKAADWYEREAFDLFGILFRGHPDLRRILTDYGFVGHPFRKDFPLIGNVEVRYDPAKGRVVYEPVGIEPRTLVPRVIRDDNRYDAALKDPARHG